MHQSISLSLRRHTLRTCQIGSREAPLQHPANLPRRRHAQPRESPRVPDEPQEGLREADAAPAVQPDDGVLERDGEGLGEVEREGRPEEGSVDHQVAAAVDETRDCEPDVELGVPGRPRPRAQLERVAAGFPEARCKLTTRLSWSDVMWYQVDDAPGGVADGKCA